MNNQLTTIDFRGATLVAVRGDTPETTMVAMKPVVEGMGLDWEKQRERINSHPVLKAAPSIRGVQLPGDTQKRDHMFMPWNRLAFWLATVNPKQVAPSVRGRVIEYQTECADVLFAHFWGQSLTGSDEMSAENRQITGGIVKAVTNKAIAALRSELRGDLTALEAKVTAMVEGFDQTQGIVTNYRPMLDILIAEGVISSKGRRSFSKRCSDLLRRWIVRNDARSAVRESRETGRYLFHVDATNKWLASEGRCIIKAHKDKIAGQGILRLIPDRQDRP